MKLKLGLILLALIPTFFILYYILPNTFKIEASLPVSAENTQTAPASNEIGISFVGDIMFASNVEDKIKQTNPHYPFEKVRYLLTSSDFVMGNLETSVSVGGSPQDKQFTFRSSPQYLESVKWTGINILSTANNHILDYGTNALTETLNNLDHYGLLHCGAGMNISDAFKPVIINKNNKKLAFFAASHVIPSGNWYAVGHTPGVAGAYNPALLLQKVKESSQTNNLTVVYMHWGIEKAITPDSTQKTLAHQLIDNGADIVVGTHSHTVQGFEYYKGKLISYSLGNFVFTNQKNDSIILNVEVSDDGKITARVIPCEINQYRPEPLTSIIEKEEFYKMLEGRSVNVRIAGGELKQLTMDN